MKSSELLFLGKDPAPFASIQAAVKESGVAVSHSLDWFSALQHATASPLAVMLIGPDIPAQDVRLLLERTKSNSSLRDLPLVLLVENASREKILEFITIGIRSYILIPCPETTLRRRIASHIPALSEKSSNSPGTPKKSVGDRLRDRIQRRLEEKLHAPSPDPTFPDIPLLEQIFSQNLGLTVRESERQVSLYEKIDDLRLRLGGDGSHLVGVLVQLLSAGKVRIGFREKTERLSLVDQAMLMPRENAMELVDSYLSHASKDASDSEPSTLTCRFVMPS